MVFEDRPTTADHFKIKHYYLKCERNQCYFVGLNNASMKNHVTEKHSNSKEQNDQEAETTIQVNIKSEVKIEIDENWWNKCIFFIDNPIYDLL